MHWIADPPEKAELQVKIRHGPTMLACVIEASGKEKIKVKMAEGDPGIASGQSAIFYDGEYCLGGGIIE